MPENNLSKIAIILVNYNSSQFTLECVQSIQESTAAALPYEIVVVDNRSRKEEWEKLAPLAQNSRVKLVRSRFNGGFALGNMLGVNAATASVEYYYFLNNDCLLKNDVLSILHQFCEQNASVALCSGLMYGPEGQVQVNFDYFPSLASKLLGTSLLRLFFPKKFPPKRVPSQPLAVDLLSGSSMFVRASAFRQIGGLDVNYFLFCEEEDLALRLRRAGHAVYLVPEAHFIHFESGSGPKTYPMQREFYISFLYFYRKHYGIGACWVLQLFLFFKLLRKFHKSTDYVRLAWFVGRGAPVRASLRLQQSLAD
ncbi:MAG: glycosyltransferase family 2 protein [Microscillaceae bacterium]|nr:glycosyltransferase family 2 protein [Microscillaceae bacterium]